jgi:copper transport protein
VIPRERRRFVRHWCAALLLMLLAAAQPSAAFAHASLIASDPANEAVLAVAPASLTLTFNEAVTPLLMRIIDQRGAATGLARIERRGDSLVVMPPPGLGAGAYILSWRVISEDGHPVGGALTFWIGARSAPAPDVVGSESASVRYAIWATRLVIYLGLFVGAGGAFFISWMKLSPRLRGPRAVAVATSLAGLLALALSVGLQGLDALAAPPPALALSATWFTGAAGTFGLSAAIAGVALIAGLLSLQWYGSAAKILSAVALAGVGLSLAASGHAATADPRMLAVASVALHGAGLAFWIGALVPLVFALGSRDSAIWPLLRFSRAVPLPLAVLLASGLLLAVLQVQHVSALWTTDYGRVLLIKLALVAALLGIAVWNRLGLTPRIAEGLEAPRRAMQKSIVCELILVAGILGVVGLWRFTPPPRLLVATADHVFVHLHTDKAMANVTLSPGNAGPIAIDVQLETPDEQTLNAMAVSVTLSNPELGIEPITAQAQRTGDGQWRVQMTAPVAGRWSLGLGILVSDFDKISVEAPVVIR